MDDFDLVIVGCGPAGLSALLWASELGLSAVALEEREEAGGQLLNTYNRIQNHLGTKAADGREMRSIFLNQIESLNPDIRTGARIESIRPGANMVRLEDGSLLSYKALLVATGVRRRVLGVPGEMEFRGRGILTSGKREAGTAKEKEAVVIGGGDAAFENALILSGFARRVTLIHRREVFTARPEFVEDVQNNSKIEILKNRRVKSFNGTDCLESVTLSAVENGGDSVVAAQAAIVRIGVEPNSELLKGICATDKQGYLIVDTGGATTSKNIYAAGDVANPLSPTISSAVGMAAAAVKTIRQIN